MKSIESFVEPLKTPITTWTFRLRFPNGDEVEVPEPPKDQWELIKETTYDWPHKYFQEVLDSFWEGYYIQDEQAKCWWHDYQGRSRIENPQVLWKKLWHKIPEKKPEPEKPVWEFLGDPKYL